MSRLAWIVGFLALVACGGGLLAPVLWWAAHGIERSVPTYWMHVLVNHPFHRYVHRCLLLVAVAGVWPLARVLGIRSWHDLGLRPARQEPVRVLAGAVLGLLIIGTALSVELALGSRQWSFPLPADRIVIGALRAVLSGMVVAAIEESLFRGLLCGGLDGD